MKNVLAILIAAAAVLSWPAPAAGYALSQTGSVAFTSDGNPPGLISLESFDSNDGTLLAVVVRFWHSGSVRERADNDDPLDASVVRARMIRQWRARFPGAPWFSVSKALMSDPAVLAPDDGDLALFDAAPPDGRNFGELAYFLKPAGTFFPASLSLYETSGPGTIAIEVDPVLMVNDLAFAGQPPDAWQMEVQRPRLAVVARVTYFYIPEPWMGAWMGAGLAAAVRRRSR